MTIMAQNNNSVVVLDDAILSRQVKLLSDCVTTCFSNWPVWTSQRSFDEAENS